MMERQTIMLCLVYMFTFLTGVAVARENDVNDMDIAIQAFELRMEGRVDEAMELLEKTVAANPENAPAQFELARVHFCTTMDSVGRTEGTLKQKQKAMKDKLRFAQKAIEQAVKADPDNPRYHYWAGKIGTYNAVYDAHFIWTMPAVPIRSINFIKSYEKAIMLKPDFYQARHELIGLYERLPWYCGGNKHKAEYHAKKLEQMEPESGDDDLLIPPPVQMKTRVGIYDSRAVACAYWAKDDRLDSYHGSLTEQIEKAEAEGNEKRAKELHSELWDHRKLLHKQVFSNEPINDVLKRIEDELSLVMQEANVVEMVSKWDKKSLKHYKSAEFVDVTDLLVAKINPGEETLKTIHQLKEKEPIPPWQLEMMMKFEGH
ncbi:MAG: tetratricopeptide repeat protein [Planctomycetota bacterium]